MKGRRLAVTSTADRGVERLRLHGVRQAPDVSALAGLDDRLSYILIWHHHDIDLPGEPAAVTLNVRGLPIDKASCEDRTLPHRHRPRQRLYRVEENGLARPADGRSDRLRFSVPRCWPRSSLPTGSDCKQVLFASRLSCPVKPSP